jgi:hypothetical protein
MAIAFIICFFVLFALITCCALGLFVAASIDRAWAPALAFLLIAQIAGPAAAWAYWTGDYVSRIERQCRAEAP